VLPADRVGRDVLALLIHHTLMTDYALIEALLPGKISGNSTDASGGCFFESVNDMAERWPGFVLPPSAACLFGQDDEAMYVIGHHDKLI
jgi:hypothetical protein